MFRFEKTLPREERYRHKRDNPSFSSSLLDQICRSIDDNDGIGDTENEDLKFDWETMQKKQSKGNMKWMEKMVSEKENAEKKQIFKEFKRKSHHDLDHDHEVIFFSSNSSSSDSSSVCFSSSDPESMYGSKTKATCFAPTRPKPFRTSVSARPEKPLFYEHTEFHMFDDYHYNTPKPDESIFESKSRAIKIYGNLKKVKQPVSPGGRLASFINSLFTKKTKNSSSILRYNDDDERKLKSSQVSTTCSSASSFSRSCLSKNSLSTREKSRNGVKRTVRFCPVSVIVDEDSRPCGPTAWNFGKSPSRKCEEEVKFQIMEKSKRVEEMAREFIKEHHQNQKNSHYVDEDDDAASDSSSDLFELDHHILMGNDRYKEELPVYETTHVETNRAIANGLIL